MTIDEKVENSLKSFLWEVEIKDVEGWKKFKVVATNETKDRRWEIVKADWWKFDNYMKNPVILLDHIYKIENIIWKADKVYKSGKDIIVEGTFSNSNPKAVLLSKLYDEWMVKSVSVWFKVIKRNESERNIIEQAELLELSFVAVPCNPEALSLDKKDFEEAIKAWVIKEDISIEKEMKNIKEELSEIKTLLKDKNKKEKMKEKMANIADLTKKYLKK